MSKLPDQAHRLVNEVDGEGVLSLRIQSEPIAPLAPGELLLRVEAAPLHPTDLGQLLLAGDLTRARREADALVMPLREAARGMFAGRVGLAVPIGSEGAGAVIAVGDAKDQALIGRRVASFSGGMYADYRVLKVADVTVLPPGASARDGAAITVNPMTALAMVETMRRDGAVAMVHTAAASSLGRMLQRICAQDGIPLVNIVRNPEQSALLRKAGAAHVVNSEDPDFQAQLVAALVETNATIAFDAVGGGSLAGAILTAMEQAQQRRAGGAGFYGSSTPKRAYIYGRLDMTPTILPPTMGMAWNVGGFLLPHVLEQVGPTVKQRLVDRVLDELTSTFLIDYTQEIPLESLLDPLLLARANAKATGAKYLVRPDT